MLRKTPLARSREKPRRNEGRVQHQRTRPKEGASPTAEENRHMEQVAAMGCLVCGGLATIHHVTARVTGGRIRRSHQRIVPLCPAHHQIQHGPRESVEALGHGGFRLTYGIDLLAVADRLWGERNG